MNLLNLHNDFILVFCHQSVIESKTISLSKRLQTYVNEFGSNDFLQLIQTYYICGSLRSTYIFFLTGRLLLTLLPDHGDLFLRLLYPVIMQVIKNVKPLR